MGQMGGPRGPGFVRALKALLLVGTVMVLADYGAPNNVTFVLTIMSANGQLLVSDIQISGPMCAQPVEIDSGKPC